MKKIVSLVLLITALSSCSEDITRNSPSFQGLKDNVLWRAAGITATKTSNGHVTITGVRQLETLVIKVNSTSEMTYELGLNSQRMATFTTADGFDETVYSTGNSITNQGDGELTIEEYDDVRQTISGTFRFNAVNQADGAEDDVVNFQEGIFYKIPLVPAE